MSSDYVFVTYHVSCDDVSTKEVERLALEMVNNAGPNTQQSEEVGAT